MPACSELADKKMTLDAYDLARLDGFTGSRGDFIKSQYLNGGIDAARAAGYEGDESELIATTVDQKKQAAAKFLEILSGPPGPPGKDGKDGAPGSNGQDGKDGANGQDGQDGAPGQNGRDGIDGKDGRDGVDGEKGDMPTHQWDGTRLRFEMPDGRWGQWVDLRGTPTAVNAGGGAATIQRFFANFAEFPADGKSQVLYFAQDSTPWAVYVWVDGQYQHVGGGLEKFRIAHAGIQRTTDAAFLPNTPTEITFDTTDTSHDCANDGTNGITVTHAGIYNYQFSVQFANSDSQAHTAWVWLKVNNSDAPGTASQFTVPSKHGSADGHLIGAANFFVSLQAGDAVKMFSASDSALVKMEAKPAQTTPFAMPSTPSVVATLTFVSA